MRCDWAEFNDYFYPYHDDEWGVPNHDDQHLFEMLNLEGAQAGLSWLTVLKKRDRYRQVFDQFSPDKVASYDDEKRYELLQDAGIIRNKLKVNAFIENAKSTLSVQKEFGSLDSYVWSFIDRPLTHRNQEHADIISQNMSKDMKKRGFKFIGPTICMSFMEATGMINNHSEDCYRFREIEETKKIIYPLR